MADVNLPHGKTTDWKISSRFTYSLVVSVPCTHTWKIPSADCVFSRTRLTHDEFSSGFQVFKIIIVLFLKIVIFIFSNNRLLESI